VRAQRLERLQDVAEFEIAADLLRLPESLHRAVREVHEAQARAGRGGGSGRSSAGGELIGRWLLLLSL